MKDNLLKNFRSFFNSKPKVVQSEIKHANSQIIEPRTVSFGPSDKSVKVEQNDEDSVDLRYNLDEDYPSLKELGLKKDEIEEGEIPILYEKNFVFCKFNDLKYDETILIVTNYKICLRSSDSDFVFFPLGKIDKLVKYTTNESVYKMIIQLKDGRKFKFRISSEAFWKKIYDKIESFAFIRAKKNFFAFRHFEANQKLEEQFKGWRLYDPIAEFQRMGITMMGHTEDVILDFKSDFKILDNREGKICSTYPAILVVPSRMPYDSLIRCAKFRSKQRMPALTFAYEYEKGKFACIYRSSQSKVGMQNSRSTDDELMLRFIGNPSDDSKSESTSQTVNCKIYDARGYYAALGNKISGKGFESEEFYSNCKLEFLNIPNIHAVRDAYNKTVEAAFGEDSKFYSTLAEAKWYEFIFLILYGGLDLAKNLVSGTNCLVHCSDGWDRTAQLSALASIILDPYYRTIEGFQILIEKDWMNFGHQFAKRLGQGMNNPTSEDKSQVFLQYLDCVTQIMYQFPSEFQFNYRYIQEIGEQSYSNLYGNFLCNCYKQMMDYNITTKTISLWSKIRRDRDLYLNPFYVPVQKNLLSFDANQRNMRFWKEHFLQHVDSFRDVYGIYSCKFTEDNLEIMHRHITQEQILLEEKYADNENVLAELESQIQHLQKKQITSIIESKQSELGGEEPVILISEVKESE